MTKAISVLIPPTLVQLVLTRGNDIGACLMCSLHSAGRIDQAGPVAEGIKGIDAHTKLGLPAITAGLGSAKH